MSAMRSSAVRDSRAGDRSTMDEHWVQIRSAATPASVAITLSVLQRRISTNCRQRAQRALAASESRRLQQREVMQPPRRHAIGAISLSKLHAYDSLYTILILCNTDSRTPSHCPEAHLHFGRPLHNGTPLSASVVNVRFARLSVSHRALNP